MMATILLAAAGSAVGAGFGGSLLGLSGAVIGRAVGATLGRVIDQRVLGVGSEAVETGRVDRFRLSGASEGAPIGRLFGRMRLAGQVIWASRFAETATTTGSGKGSARPQVTEYSYLVSLAVALCEGPITRVGRIWADGVELARDDITLRVYDGSETQVPDPRIEAVEGAGNAPAYRGIAYVVIEDLALARFGNRIPQFSFEVVRGAQVADAEVPPDLTQGLRAVALIPGTGEYALATTPVHFVDGPGVNRSANVNSPSGKTDMATTVETLAEELPNCGSVSLVVSWFGDDLRCGSCTVKPKVEQTAVDGTGMPWKVSGVVRGVAETVPLAGGRPVYGGTPADQSVVEAITALRASGQAVMFYPFILMEQQAGNGKTDPWTGAPDQPVLPWRGRITLSIAPGRVGTPDRTAAAAAEVAAFFGTAAPAHFSISGTEVLYSGPVEFSFRRFILHYAHLAAAAGGVDAFCIGSELRGLTQIRAAADAFVVVAALQQLAVEVRTVLGPGVKISYAADWSEYFGYQDGAGNLYYHLDPLWSDPAVDFIGIDNYMPLSDWRDGDDHADAGYRSIYNLEYLKANIAGGEGYDWYYASPEAQAEQVRTPITDGAYDEPWVYRYKDLRSWWSLEHRERIAGIRQAAATTWVPGSKPIWFTEMGCPAIDKGTNEPNKFIDPKSSESTPPRYSNGRRDDLMQMQYLRAMVDFWADPANNPDASLYAGPMVDMAGAHVWAWDTRPFPQFPNALTLWADGENYAKGHWISGRTSAQPLANVVAEICERGGVASHDTSRLYGAVRGFTVSAVETARSALQPLMLAYGFDAVERDGGLTFAMRSGRTKADLPTERLVLAPRAESAVETSRAPVAEVAGRVRLTFVGAEADYEIRGTEAIFPDDATVSAVQSDLPLVLTEAEGRGIAERWLAEARVARDRARFVLPPSLAFLGAGDVASLQDATGVQLYRIDRVEQAGANAVEAVRVEPGLYQPSDFAEERVVPRAFVAPVPTYPLFLDLPMMTGDEVPYAPHVAVTATPWPGTVAVYSSGSDDGYVLNRLLAASATIGVTQSTLEWAAHGLWDRGAALRVKVYGGALASASQENVLNGANLMAIGDGSSDVWELFQFATATLVEPQAYDLSLRLRGQLGSDGLMPESWPPGSQVVLINSALEQIGLAATERGLARHFRIGAAQRGYDDPSYVHLVAAFQGIGLRPYAPAHLTYVGMASGDLVFDWVRRTRIDGDSWASIEVPLGEENESYLVRVMQGATVVREASTSVPTWTYAASAQVADAIVGAYSVRVAQVSSRFGAGLFRSLAVPG